MLACQRLLVSLVTLKVKQAIYKSPMSTKGCLKTFCTVQARSVYSPIKLYKTYLCKPDSYENLK